MQNTHPRFFFFFHCCNYIWRQVFACKVVFPNRNRSCDVLFTKCMENQQNTWNSVGHAMSPKYVKRNKWARTVAQNIPTPWHCCEAKYSSNRSYMLRFTVRFQHTRDGRLFYLGGQWIPQFYQYQLLSGLFRGGGSNWWRSRYDQSLGR